MRTHRSLEILALSIPLFVMAACGSPPAHSNPAEPVTSSEVAATPAKKLLTLEEAAGPRAGRMFTGRVANLRWASDGVHLEKREKGKIVWTHPRTKDRKEVEDPGAGRREELRTALEAMEGIDEAAASRAMRSARIGDGDGKPAVVRFGDDLYFHRSGSPARRLTEGPEEEQDAEASPDGRYVAFVREHDLHVVDTNTGEERPLTSGGNENLLHGRLDWVYQEEVYGRGRWKGFWWSPESDAITFLRLDESNVHAFTVVDHVPNRLETQVTRYPKTGDPNPVASLGVATPDGGEIVWLDLSRYDGEEFLIVRVGWTPDGSHVLFQVQDRIQTWLDLNLGDPVTGAVTNLLRETSTSWVNILGEPRWLEDGTFLWQSERTGYNHLYHYAADGTLLRPVTHGKWEVRRILEIDEASKRIWFTGSRDGAVVDNVYRIGLDGKGLRRLTKGDGSHSVRLNGDRSLFLDTVSSLKDVPELRLCDGNGKIVEVMERAKIAALETHEYVHRELLEIPARDGFVLDATLLKPPSFNPRKSYPVWLPTYSGPNAPSVRNRWDGNAWHQFLAQQGYLVFQVNNRSSSRKGQVTSGTCYKRLGFQELADLEDAVRWLCRNRWADGSRVGIYGWSYGGFMAAFALTHSDAFSLGIAGAGVYDWRLYDTIYTERFMSTPELNPEGYDETSCLKAAGDLKGHLLLLHGTMDDNVHMQNTIQFAYELQKANRSFELMLYPRSRHGVREAPLRWHMRQLMWNTIQEYL